MNKNELKAAVKLLKKLSVIKIMKKLKGEKFYATYYPDNSAITITIGERLPNEASEFNPITINEALRVIEEKCRRRNEDKNNA